MIRKTTVMKTKTRTAAKTATWEKRAERSMKWVTLSTLQQPQTVMYNRIQDSITLRYVTVLLKYTQVVCIRRSRARRPAEFVASQRTADRDERLCRVSTLCTCTGETHTLL